jgi:hypothetical protein
MDSVGIDVHMKQSKSCFLTEVGELVYRCIRTA